MNAGYFLHIETANLILKLRRFLNFHVLNFAQVCTCNLKGHFIYYMMFTFSEAISSLHYLSGKVFADTFPTLSGGN